MEPERNHGYGKRIKPRQYNRQTPVVEAPMRSGDSKSDAEKLEELKRAFRKVQR
ncbi:hypothetical protein VSR68_03330 [Paraburkholderia phymatum]|uniref:hypothetical protein n=1 Tax=Paraburkholderia phymatum TaxID=148447 RepID=UPI00317FEC83